MVLLSTLSPPPPPPLHYCSLSPNICTLCCKCYNAIIAGIVQIQFRFDRYALHHTFIHISLHIYTHIVIHLYTFRNALMLISLYMYTHIVSFSDTFCYTFIHIRFTFIHISLHIYSHFFTHGNAFHYTFVHISPLPIFTFKS